jgi:hypothetical protein
MGEAVAPRGSWLQDRREAAWAFGREQRDRLLQEYAQKYGQVDAPPAKLVHTLVPEFLQAKLEFAPLPPDRFAETRLEGGRPVVLVNSDIAEIDGVRDAEGVENVALWHECIHLVRDIAALVRPATVPLPGFDEPYAIVCYRGAGRASGSSQQVEQEFWAEEAGRAAAVSIEALRQTDAFCRLLQDARRASGPVRHAWPLLYQSASAIGVNISALIKQLTYEGLIVVDGLGGRSTVTVQPALTGLAL